MEFRGGWDRCCGEARSCRMLNLGHGGVRRLSTVDFPQTTEDLSLLYKYFAANQAALTRNMKKNKQLLEEIHVDLDIQEHLKMQEGARRFQQVGLFCILLFVGSAAFGLYGNGVVSKKHLTKDEINIHFERFFRFQAKMGLQIQATNDRDISISFPIQYLNHFEISSIVPEPTETRVEGSQVKYAFKGRDELTATFYLVPQQIGQIKGSVNVNENTFSISHFIFP